MSDVEDQWVVEDVKDEEVVPQNTLVDDGSDEEDASEEAKKAKRRENKKRKLAELKQKSKSKKQKRGDVATDLKEANSTSELAEIFWRYFINDEKMKASLAEIEKQAVLQQQDILKLSGGKSLGGLLGKLKPGIRNMELKQQSPAILIIAQSGIRCADLCRDLKSVAPQRGAVCKLFAKHLKIQDQIDALSQCLIAVGTPNRLMKLCEQGALDLADRCELIVVDLAPNEKKMTLLDQPQLKNDFLQFFHSQVNSLLDSRADSNKMQIAFNFQ
jgi:protein CMS1